MTIEKAKELMAALPKEVIELVKKFIKEGMKPTEAVKKAWKEYKKIKKEKAQESPEQPKKIARTITEQIFTTVQTFNENGDVIEKHNKTRTINEWTDGTKDESETVNDVTDKLMIVEKATIETKDIEIKTLKEELGKKDQEIAELKVIKKEREDSTQTDLDVGQVRSPDAYKAIRQSIDEKAFGKKQDK